MKNLKAKKMCLGTAQLGMNYGINNKTGKLSKDEAYKLLDMARAYGVEYLDTAAVYGDSEELIGNYLVSRKAVDSFKIITKINLKVENINDIKINVKNAVNSSLKKLSLECLDGLMIHTPKDFLNIGFVESLLDIKKMGYIKNLGVSVYEYEEGINIATFTNINYIQIPYNILDQRFDKVDFIEQINKTNIKVFARSPLLQGLLLMDNIDIPENLSEVKQYIDQIDSITRDTGFSRFEIAVLFAYTSKHWDYMVFGVDSIDHFKQYIQVIEKEDEFLKFRKELEGKFEGKFEGIGNKIIMPNKWN